MMTLLALELSDAGVMVAGGEPAQLLKIDKGEKESPGYAIIQNGHLIVGKDAQDSARLNPRLYTNRFWDELNTDPLKQIGFEGKNNAELAYLHLLRIWDFIKRQGDELVIAVPGFFTQSQLGLILGITKELSIPVKGFAATALAASSKSFPNHLLFYLDIHLHRIELTYLEQEDQLLYKNSETLSGNGLNYLYSEWIRAIADEFVRTTRFDPFDQAIYEQELYRRLPQVLKDIQGNPSVVFTMKAGHQTYSITITYDLLAKTGKAVFREVRQLIEEIAEKYNQPRMPLIVEVTHRVSQLPGYREELQKIPVKQIVELEQGSSAMGILELKDRFTIQAGQGVTFLTSRSWQTTQQFQDFNVETTPQDLMRPTHILYGNLAYPISHKPLIIGQVSADGVHIHVSDQIEGVSRKHCTIQSRGDTVVLVDHSISGTFVDGTKVSGTTMLRRGQTIRIGTPGEEFHLITCVRSNET
ncbi:MAG: FHA domain-containing protein [Candidatus Brocadiaceae bacterium]|nr:FHA domain-containing protein [Candidatus Brocadiaceae bacterium]